MFDPATDFFAHAVVHFKAYLLTEKRVALNTYKAYCADIDRFCAFVMVTQVTGASESSITRAMADNFFKELKRRALSHKTIMRVAACLRLFGRYLLERHQLETPLLGIVITGAGTRLPKHCPERDISFLLDAYDPQAHARNHLIINLLYTTGMRASEVASLQLSDINYDDETVRVLGKRGKQRLVPLPSDTVELIKAYTVGDRLEQVARARNHSVAYLFPVFRAGRVGSITRTMIWRIVKQAFLRAVSKHAGEMQSSAFYPHMFRHALATHLVKHDWDLRSIQLMLGHEQIQTVEVYTHLDISDLKSVYKKKHPRS